MNKVILMGRLTADPEVRYSQAAEPVAVATYRLAVNRRFKREGQPEADFIPCRAFRNTAEFAQKYFKKGQMVAVSGSLQISQYDDKNGNRQYYTEVLVDDQYFAESKASFESRRGGGQGFDPTADIPPYVGGGQGGFDVSSSYGQGGYDAAPSYGQNQSRQSGGDTFIPIEGSIDDEDLPF